MYCPFQMLMSALRVLTTVNNCVPTLQEALPVAVTLDIGCWVMDTSVKVYIYYVHNVLCTMLMFIIYVLFIQLHLLQ